MQCHSSSRELTLNKDDEANIRHIRIYKEQDKVDSEKQEQIDIYTAQVEKREDTATQQTSTDDIHTSQTPLQENQNLIHLEAYLTSGKALKKIFIGLIMLNTEMKLYGKKAK